MALTLRQTEYEGVPAKNSKLTFQEMDDNFIFFGDKTKDTVRGNITVSNSGATWTINNDVVTNAKLAFDGGALSGFRNVIINGGFNINQRVYTSDAATTAGQYTLDRWKVTDTGGITFSTTANKTTVTIPLGQTLQQVVEGLNLQSGTYVLSWEGTAQGRIGVGSYGVSGITGSITGGTDTTIEFNSGTVANVQLEVGTTATAFEARPYGTELILCQRYLPCLAASTSSEFLCGGYAISNTDSRSIIEFKTMTRTRPTGITITSASHFYLACEGSDTIACSAVFFNNASLYNGRVEFNVPSGLTSGHGVHIFTNNSSAKILFTGCEL